MHFRTQRHDAGIVVLAAVGLQRQVLEVVGLGGQVVQPQGQRTGTQEMRALAQQLGIAAAVGAVDQAHLLGGVGDEESDQLLHQPGALGLELAQLLEDLRVQRIVVAHAGFPAPVRRSIYRS